MAFLNFWGNYNKPGPGVSKDEAPKAAPIRFFEIFFRKFSKLVQANLIFLIPTAIVLVLAFLLFPGQLIVQIPLGEGASPIQIDLWKRYIMPLPFIFLSPFVAGLTLISRNFAREEHAFVWSDFWSTVKSNWKYFLLNGLIIYLVYVALSFSILYYYNRAALEQLFYMPFWICLVVAIVFLFAQYYLPVIFITFDLKFGAAYRNALIFSVAGLGRNILITVILGGLFFLVYSVIPFIPPTIFTLLILIVFILFSFVSFLINFTVYPVIDRYLIKPYEQMVEDEKNGAQESEGGDSVTEKFSGLFASAPNEDFTSQEESEEKYVYINGKLVKRSEWQAQEDEKDG